MGGSGSTRPRTPRRSCEDLIFIAPLQTPDMEVIAQIEEGEFLSIELQTGQDFKPIAARTENDEVAGFISTGHSGQLRACLERGYLFTAKVETIELAHCIVEIWCVGRK